VNQLPRSLAAMASAVLLLCACGGPSAHEHATVAGNPATGASTDEGGVATPTISPGATANAVAPGTLPSGESAYSSSATASRGGSRATGSPPQSSGGTAATTSPPPSGCPDPRSCSLYALSGQRWIPDNSGRVVLHYKVNATAPAPLGGLSAQLVQQAIDSAANAWMTADPSVVLIDDGLTTEQPAFNSVIGFSTGDGPEDGQADTETTCNTCNTLTAWDIVLHVGERWTWEPCDPAGGSRCDSYGSAPNAGIDVQDVTSHELGHVLGLAHPGSGVTVNGQDAAIELTMYPGPDEKWCYGTLIGCRDADTPGMGDVLGLRHLYPTSAPMPTLYDP